MDGIIVHSPRMQDSRIALLSDLGLPFVVHGRASDITSDYSWVDMNNRRAFERATAFLTELGHRRIALVNGLEHMDFAYRRRKGYLSALAAQGIGPDATLMRAGEMTELLGHKSARDMLRGPRSAHRLSDILDGDGDRRAPRHSGGGPADGPGRLGDHS